jgi:hypothetical protein
MRKIKITEYDLKGKLPDPFIFDDGRAVECADDWAQRRKEIYKTAVELQYGTPPPSPEILSVDVLYSGGPNNCSAYRITTGKRDKTVSFDMTVFKTAGKEKAPTVISGDLCFPYAFNKEYISTFTDNGINLVLFNRTVLFPDVAWYNTEKVDESSGEYEKMKSTVESYDADKPLGELARIYPEYSFGAIAAWAWGYSRCVDALELLGFADMDCIAFTGHSRGGKTAMLAGALDERAAIVNPNAACAGGCSCYRLRIKAIIEDGVTEKESEPLSNIVHHFPLWLSPEMRKYIGREQELPFDSHYLKALVAPRVLFVSEAASDIMANPVGSWQTTMGAAEVYKLLGAEENLLWYYRSGTHFHDIEDISQLVNVIRHYKWGEELNNKYFKAPFEGVEPAFDWSAPKN